MQISNGFERGSGIASGMLYEFLAANRAAIIARTRARVGPRSAPSATEEELESGIPMFLDQLIRTLQFPDADSNPFGESATRHGRALLRRGFTVAQVVHDYGGVCQAVTELASEMNAHISTAEFQTFNRCLDDAIAQAVTEYGRQREQSITEDGRVRSGELAHELRNVLGAARLAFETITTGRVGPSGSTAALLGRSLGRLATLVDSSIAQVRLEAGIRAPERVSIREFFEDVEVGAAMQATARGVTLTVPVVEMGMDVNVDPQLLAGAVANLLQNAFKFTPPHGHVVLKASAVSDRVIIDVEDQCGGLPAGKTDELFSRFKQRGSDRTGLGLGLSISRQSVEADGGKLSVRDVPGIGCVFTIDLPRLRSSS
jgi:signal transduction histidine kinase